MNRSVLDATASLTQVLHPDSFREVCRSFSELYGIGVKIFDQAGNKLADIRASTADHCGYLFSVHPTRVMCTQLVGKIRTAPLDRSGAPLEIGCFSGLRYQVVPILHEGDIVGRVILGPYAPDTLEKPPSDLVSYQKDGLDVSTLAGFLSAVPRVSEVAVDKLLAHLRNVLDVVLHTSFRAYLTSQLHIASITGAFEDVRKSNASLEQANSRLTELDRLKSNFVATVSHELRTPLTSVIGYSEMLLEGMAGELTPEQEQYVRTILEKGESLLQLIGQVLDLSRIDSGNVTIAKENVAPAEILKLGVSDVVPQAKKRRHTIETRIAETLEPIAVDADKIRRVISNLLSNAIKFTPAGSSIRVEMEAVEAPPDGENFDVFEPDRNRFLRIAVHDEGIGIPDHAQGRIFDSFFQVDSSSTREFGGSGLGLSIVRNFVHAHGGRVTVESQDGKGSTFTVLLPYATRAVTTPVGVDGLMA